MYFPKLPKYRHRIRFRQYCIDFVFEEKNENKSDLASDRLFPIVFIPIATHHVSIVVRTCCISYKCMFQVFHEDVSSTCFKCFKCSKWMLQVYQANVAGDWVKWMLQVFHLHVSSISGVQTECCKCFILMLQRVCNPVLENPYSILYILQWKNINLWKIISVV
jgi:hypothetical protein